MAKIQSKLTGDVFEAPAVDFANEADFEIVDDTAPITTTVVPNVSTDGAVSATAPSDTSGTTASTVDTSSATDSAPPAVVDPVLPAALATDPTSVSADPQAAASPLADGGAGEAGNVPATVDSSETATVAPSDAVSATPASGESVTTDDSGNASGAAADAAQAPVTDSSTLPEQATTDADAAATPSSGTADVGNVAGSPEGVSSSGATTSSGSLSSLPTADLGNVAASPVDAVTPAPVDASADLGNVATATSSDAAAGTGDLGNVDASSTGSLPESTDASPVAAVSDSVTADANTPVDPITPPVTDSVSGSPTGGPSAGNGATLDSKGKHIVANQLESDTLYAIGQIVTVNDSLQHAADAFFDQVRSQIDVEATQ